MISSHIRAAAILLGAVSGSASLCQGASYAWSNSAGGNWTTASNWSPAGGPPVTGDIANFNLNANYPVDISLNGTGAVNVTNGVVTFRRTGTIGFLDLTSGLGELAVQANSQLNVGSAGFPVGIIAGDLFRIQSGATANIRAGSSVQTGRLGFATAGSAVSSFLFVSGANSRLSVGHSGASSPTSFIGGVGARGALTLSGGGVGTFAGPLALTQASANNSRSRVLVAAGSQLTTADLLVGDTFSATATGQEAFVDVLGSGALMTMTGASNLTIGSAINHNIAARVHVDDHGVIHSGTGNIHIRNSGVLSIGTEGTFHANGHIVVDRGLLTGSAGSDEHPNLALAPGRSITIRNGGAFEWVGARGLHLHGGTTLSLQTGGTLDITALTLAGQNSTGDAAFLLSGPGSNATVMRLGDIGRGGHSGTIRLTNAAALQHTLNPVRLAEDPSAGTTGIIEVLSGSSVSSSGDMFLATLGGDTTSARIAVSGPGSQFTHQGNISIGHHKSGSAEIEVADGGVFAAGTSGNPTTTVRATGHINVKAGGRYNTRGDVRLEGGSITLEPQGVFDALGTVHQLNGQFNFVGGTLHVDQFNGDLINQGGKLAPGRPIGITSINGNYTQQPGAELNVHLAGANLGGAYDKLLVSGSASLAGMLSINLFGGFVPQPGDRFDIVSASAGVTGTFDSFIGREIDPTTWLATIYGPTSVTLAVARPGDANLDGVVNLADFNRLAANFGASNANWLMGDFTGDGLVNLADFNILAANFGLSAGPDGPTPDDWTALGAAVPEPGTATVLAGVLSALLCRRRRNNQRSSRHPYRAKEA